MGAANGSAPLRREELDLQRGELRVRMSGHRLEQDRARLPQTLDRFEYTASTRDAAPVSRISLSFWDFSRTLSVEGQSPDQVDAVFSVLRDDLWKLSTLIGGPIFGSLRFMAMFLLGLGLLFLGSSWLQTCRRTLLAPILFVVALLIALVFLPIDDLLSGFTVVRGDASFMVRYGAEMSFWGLIIGVIGLGLSLVPLLRQPGVREAKNGP